MDSLGFCVGVTIKRWRKKGRVRGQTLNMVPCAPTPNPSQRGGGGLARIFPSPLWGGVRGGGRLGIPLEFTHRTQAKGSSPQHPARRLAHAFHNPLAQRLKLRLIQRLLDRLDCHFNGDGFLAFAERGAFELIEDVERRD
jgi:hypothetical protein